MLGKTHVRFCRHGVSPTKPSCKKGEGLYTLPLLRLAKTTIRSNHLYLVFPSSFFSGAFSAPAGAAGSPAFISPPAGAAASGAGAGAAGGGGGGGAGSSFLPHPANVRVKAKRVVPDNIMIFFPILSSPPFPSHFYGSSFSVFIAQV